MRQRSGFTLIELLTVIGVAAILLAIGLPSMQAMRQNAAQNGSIQEVVSVLRQVQGQATANQGGSAAVHSVQFGTDSSYSLVSGTTTIPYSLASGVKFTTPLHATITFNHLTGTSTAAVADITFIGTVKKISVSTTGIVTTQ